MNKSAQIYNLTAPYNNSYQGNYKKVLFVCSVGMLRSPTAANIGHSAYGWNTRSCGSSDMALIPLSVNLIEWADTIFFMDNNCFKEATDKFKILDDYDKEIIKKSHILYIDDEYNYNDQSLIFKIKQKLDSFK